VEEFGYFVVEGGGHAIDSQFEKFRFSHLTPSAIWRTFAAHLMWIANYVGNSCQNFIGDN